jgi:uncharacterized phiE125 gp8 family phage protein
VSYKITVGPVSEPITLSDAKGWLKIHEDVSEDDELVRGLIATARVWAERGTGRALLTQTVQEVWDDVTKRVFYLSIGPLVSVTSFEYRNSAGTYVTWPSTNYTVDDVTEPGRLVINSTTNLPYSTTLNTIFPNMIRITYTAGKSTAAEVDANIITAMKLQIRLMYDKREDMPLGKETSIFARSAWNLLSISRLTML